MFLLDSLKEDIIGGCYSLSHPYFAFFFPVLGDVELVLWQKREKTYLVLHLNDFFVILLYLCLCMTQWSSTYCYLVVFFVYDNYILSIFILFVTSYAFKWCTSHFVMSYWYIFLHTRLIDMDMLEWMHHISRLSQPFT